MCALFGRGGSPCNRPGLIYALRTGWIEQRMQYGSAALTRCSRTLLGDLLSANGAASQKRDDVNRPNKSNLAVRDLST